MSDDREFYSATELAKMAGISRQLMAKKRRAAGATNDMLGPGRKRGISVDWVMEHWPSLGRGLKRIIVRRSREKLRQK